MGFFVELGIRDLEVLYKEYIGCSESVKSKSRKRVKIADKQDKEKRGELGPASFV